MSSVSILNPTKDNLILDPAKRGGQSSVCRLQLRRSM